MKSLSAGSLIGHAGFRLFFLFFCLVFVSTAPLANAEQRAADLILSGKSAVASQPSLDQAIEKERQKVADDPSSEEELVRLGNLLLKKNSLDEAGKVFDQALTINARYHDALTGKGIILTRMGKNREAEETLQKALLLNPNPVRTYYELGSLYEKEGDFAKAISAYKKGIEKYKQGRK